MAFPIFHRSSILLLLFLVFPLCSEAQISNNGKAASVKAIKEIIEKENKGQRIFQFTDSFILINPALPYPFIGRQRTKEEQQMLADLKKDRSNEQLTRFPLRIQVAEAGDMAYEYGRYTVEYDNLSGQHIRNTGAYLHIWRKVKNSWKLEARFNRYNADVPQP